MSWVSLGVIFLPKQLLDMFLQGNYCINIQMNLVPASGVAVVDATQYKVPAAASSVVRQVSWRCLAFVCSPCQGTCATPAVSS